MTIDNRHPKHFHDLYQDGIELQKELSTVFEVWPIGEYSTHIPFDRRAEPDQERVQEVLLNVERWINALKLYVLPQTVHDKRKLKDILSRLKALIFEEENKREAKDEAAKLMDEALGLIRSMPLPAIQGRLVSEERRTFVANRAFIVMDMNPNQPDLEDRCAAIKEVCLRFGVHALRSDDIEHQGSIPEVVLRYIAESEFVIADLTNERPNVYFEVGHAHALNIRPILLRKTGTEVHFHLKLHNVPEYKNCVDLKKLLHQRLEAILGLKVA